MELRHVRYLLAVAEHGNFTRAADSLHISQPTLSQQIKQLERAVGAQLLDRSGRSVRLTDAGEAYAHYARRAMRDLATAQRAIHDLADLSRGSVRLAVTPTFTAYLVGPLAERLHRNHPGIDLVLTETTQDHVETGLLADEFDLGIAFHRPHPPGIAATELCTETLSLVVGAAFAEATSASAQSLSEHALALLSTDFATREHIDAYLTAHRINPRIAMEANSIQALIEIVSRTPLATVLPNAIAHHHPALTAIPLTPTLPARTVALLRRADAYESAAVRAFSGLAVEVAADR